jgi:hypothetical protein
MSPFQLRSILTVILIATLADLLIPVIIGVKYPGYSHLRHTISTLGTNESPVRKHQCLTLVIVGILFTLFALGQYHAFGSIKWSHVLYLAGIIMYGIGTIIAGVFPEDPAGMDETVSGKIHGIASGIGFLLLILNPFWSIWIAEFKYVDYIHIVVLFAAILTFGLFIVSKNRNDGVMSYSGLWQRLNLLIIYGHIVFNFLNSIDPV